MALQGRRAAPDRRGQPPPARPPGRPQAGPARPLAPRPVGARAARPRPAPRGRGARPRAGSPTPAPSRRAAVAGRVFAAAMADLDPRHNSRQLVDGPARAAARAQLKGIGFDDEALSKPIIGVASTWTETMPCNYQMRAQAAKVKEGIRDAGGTPMEFNTIAISDGITMGTSGMRASLVSREVIADSIELVARGHFFDAIDRLAGCDKTLPGTVMALARLDLPGLMLYGGSILPGTYKGKDVTIQDVFEAIGAHAAGRSPSEELTRPRGRRQPRRRRLRRPVHRQHDGDGASRCSASRRWAPRWSRPRTPSKARGRLRGRQARDGRARPRPAPERHHHPRGARERDRRRRAPAAARPTACCTCWRSPARRASTLDIDDFDRIAAAHADAVRPQARRPLRRHRPARGRRRAASSPSACRRPGCCTRTRRPSPASTIGEHAAEAQRDRGPGRRPRRSTTRSRPPAASRSCAATSRPRAAW